MHIPVPPPKQFIEQTVPAVSDDSLAAITLWAVEHLSDSITVADLARRAHVSVATLHRRFIVEINTTPHVWLNGQRVRLACRLIERGGLDFNAVALASGIGTATTLRNLMRKETGLTQAGSLRSGTRRGISLT